MKLDQFSNIEKVLSTINKRIFNWKIPFPARFRQQKLYQFRLQASQYQKKLFSLIKLRSIKTAFRFQLDGISFRFIEQKLITASEGIFGINEFPSQLEKVFFLHFVIRLIDVYRMFIASNLLRGVEWVMGVKVSPKKSIRQNYISFIERPFFDAIVNLLIEFLRGFLWRKNWNLQQWWWLEHDLL